MNKVLSILSKKEFTQVFCSLKKINFYIKNIKTFFGGRNINCKEITKIHETFIRDEIDKLKLFQNPLKGELTIVISERFSQ